MLLALGSLPGVGPGEGGGGQKPKEDASGEPCCAGRGTQAATRWRCASGGGTRLLPRE